jgi:hypothetical protein
MNFDTVRETILKRGVECDELTATFTWEELMHFVWFVECEYTNQAAREQVELINENRRKRNKFQDIRHIIRLRTGWYDRT